MATQKQVNYLLKLLDENGYGTRYMSSSFKGLGATMRERSGTVEGWLRGLNVAEASNLIDRLKESKPYKANEDVEVQQLRKDAGPDNDTAELRRIAEIKPGPAGDH